MDHLSIIDDTLNISCNGCYCSVPRQCL